MDMIKWVCLSMATTEAILSDIGSIYKRLFNHRPVLLNEVHFFVQEFEGKRGENDLKKLQETLKDANEMDAMFLEEMKQSIPHFRQLRSEIGEVVEKGNTLMKKHNDFELSEQEKTAIEKQIETHKARLAEEREQFDREIEDKIKQLKNEVEIQQETRSRLKANQRSSSTSSSP